MKMATIILLESIDNNLKKTQAELLYLWLKDKKYNVYKIDFPDYNSDSSKPLRMYLNGELGKDPKLLNPYVCSTLYCVDMVAQYIQKYKDIMTQKDAIVILTKYISSGAIFQACKFRTFKEKQYYIKWLYDFHIEKFGLPKEDMVIYLDLPVRNCSQLLSSRYRCDEFMKDVHEDEQEYLRICRDNALTVIDLANDAGANWKYIYCLNKRMQLKSHHDILIEVIKLVAEVVNNKNKAVEKEKALAGAK